VEQIQIALKKDGQIIDLQTAEAKNIEGGEPIYYGNSEDALEVIRHSTAHLMAQAIEELFPGTKFFVGPVVEGGFYYDMRINGEFSDKNLKQVEKKMQQIAKKKTPIERYEITKEQALEKFKNDDLKLEVLKKIPDEVVSIYKQGDFEDLCRGPHLPNQGLIKAFKLQKVAGAYLGGDSDREMLTRVYGTAFADKESLKAYLDMLKEAEKRDHRKLGSEMDLWFFDEKVGPGLPIWLPKGAMLRANLEKLLFRAHLVREYEPVKGPEILKSDMWKISGHYQNCLLYTSPSPRD
jgi:threonyl-tRNA synthetase